MLTYKLMPMVLMMMKLKLKVLGLKDQILMKVLKALIKALM